MSEIDSIIVEIFKSMFIVIEICVFIFYFYIIVFIFYCRIIVVEYFFFFNRLI